MSAYLLRRSSSLASTLVTNFTISASCASRRSKFCSGESSLAGRCFSTTRMSKQRITHSSQINVVGPAMSFLTSSCHLPQNEQSRRGLSWAIMPSSLVPKTATEADWEHTSVFRGTCKQSKAWTYVHSRFILSQCLIPQRNHDSP